jgi:1-acyl-sn-glycerol-3-phosphate acyltransferase
METPTLAAIIFLTLLGLCFVVGVLLAFRQRGQYSVWEFVLYSLAYGIARYLWRVTVVGGHENLQGLRSGCVIVANHRCSVDPAFIQLAAGRRVHWMVAGEYCRHFLFGPILAVLQVIPTNRGGVDSKAIKMAIRYAGEGRFVGMFPEGRINRTDQPLITIRPGAAMVAMRASVPMVPVWIEGAPVGPEVWSPFLQKAFVRIRIGPPIAQPNVTSEDNDVEQNVSKLWIQEAMQAVATLGGQNQALVKVAGKDWKHS